MGRNPFASALRLRDNPGHQGMDPSLRTFLPKPVARLSERRLTLLEATRLRESDDSPGSRHLSLPRIGSHVSGALASKKAVWTVIAAGVVLRIAQYLSNE